MKTLFIGDIVGRKARNFAIEKIKELKKSKNFDLIIVNVETNISTIIISLLIL